jgi:hypothetical protein
VVFNRRANAWFSRQLHCRPWLDKKFQNEYGPFNYAVSIVVFSLLTSFLVLAGAEWSARSRENDDLTIASQVASA